MAFRPWRRPNHQRLRVYVIEGSGEWVIDGVVHRVAATDVVVVPPGAAFYYRGDLKQVCITAPAWDEQNEEIVRQIEL